MPSARAAAPFAAAAGAVTVALEQPLPTTQLELLWPEDGAAPEAQRLAEISRDGSP